jgi:hypothetical protein
MMQKDTDIIDDLLLTADLYEDEADESELDQGTSLSLLCIRAVGEIRKLRAQIADKPAVAVPYGVDQEAANRIALAVYDHQHGIDTEPLLYAINRILIKEVNPLSAEVLAEMQSAPQPTNGDAK